MAYSIVKQTPRIEVPHRDSTLRFVHQIHEPNTYANVKQSLEQENLRTPTASELVSLLYQVYVEDSKGKEPEFKEIKKLMDSQWLWAFTGTLFTPQGVYIQDNPDIRGGMPYMEESNLREKLEQNDPAVRFVEPGYSTRDMSPIQLSREPYVKGLVGDEGASKLGEIADTFKRKPKLWVLDSVTEPQTRVTALGSDWNIGRGLVVIGYSHGNNWNGYSFGVQNSTGEASRVEK